MCLGIVPGIGDGLTDLSEPLCLGDGEHEERQGLLQGLVCPGAGPVVRQGPEMTSCLNFVDRKRFEAFVAELPVAARLLLVKQIRVTAGVAQLSGARKLAPFAQEGEALAVLVDEAADVEVVGADHQGETIIRARLLEHQSQPGIWGGCQLLLAEDWVEVVDPLAGGNLDVGIKLVEKCLVLDAVPIAEAKGVLVRRPAYTKATGGN